ncbi:MAG: hypothetical protein ACLGJC_03205 [Alphaproteobacteria bacterium]
MSTEQERYTPRAIEEGCRAWAHDGAASDLGFDLQDFGQLRNIGVVGRMLFDGGNGLLDPQDVAGRDDLNHGRAVE